MQWQWMAWLHLFNMKWGLTLGPVLTLLVIYVAPVSRVYLRAQWGMKVLTVSVGEGGRWEESYEFSQLSAQLWVSDIVFIREGGESRSRKRLGGTGGGEVG